MGISNNYINEINQRILRTRYIFNLFERGYGAENTYKQYMLLPS